MTPKSSRRALLWLPCAYFLPRCGTLSPNKPERGLPVMPIRRGDTVIFPHPPVLAAWAAVGGKKESEGPLAQGFDELVQYAGFDAEGCTGWEPAIACAKRALPNSRWSLPSRGTCRPSAPPVITPCASWGCPLPGCMVPAPPWRKRCAWRPSARQLAMRMKYSP